MTMFKIRFPSNSPIGTRLINAIIVFIVANCGVHFKARPAVMMFTAGPAISIFIILFVVILL